MSTSPRDQTTDRTAAWTSPRTHARASTTTGAARRTITFARVLASEWTRLASVASTGWTILATVFMTMGVAVGLGLFVRTGDGTTGTELVVSGVVLAQVGALVLGVLVGTADYATGTATTTYTAVPRRLPVLAAQALLTTAVALVTAAAALGASLLGTAPHRAAAGLSLDLADDGTGRALVGFVFYLVGVALLGLGAGALVRNAAGALVAAIALLVVVDQILAANPGRAADTVRALLPGVGTRLVRGDAQITAVEAASLGPHLGAAGAGLVLSTWVVAVLLATTLRLRFTDVSTAARP